MSDGLFGLGDSMSVSPEFSVSVTGWVSMLQHVTVNTVEFHLLFDRLLEKRIGFNVSVSF